VTVFLLHQIPYFLFSNLYYGVFWKNNTVRFLSSLLEKLTDSIIVVDSELVTRLITWHATRDKKLDGQRLRSHDYKVAQHLHKKPP